MRKPELCPSAISDEFSRDNRPGSFSGGGEPRQFHKPIAFEPEEPPVMRMSISFETRFEIEDRVNIAFHQDRSWYSEPDIELLCPCPIEGARRRHHRALSGQPKRP